MAPGADRATLGEGAEAVHLFRFDLAHYCADVVVTTERPQIARELRQALGASAVVNGGFFDERVRPLGLRIVHGRTVVPLRRADWGVLVIRDQRAEIVHTRDFAREARTGAVAPRRSESGDGASTVTHPSAPVRPLAESVTERITAALQVGPRLLVEGKPLSLKPQSARRTAVALDASGRLLTLVVTTGAAHAAALAARLAAAGFTTALMLDGGPSTQVSLAIGQTTFDQPGGYPVPDLLVISPRPTPATGVAGPR